MKILVINQPLNNRGDEAAHKGFIRSIVSEVENVEIEFCFLTSTKIVSTSSRYNQIM